MARASLTGFDKMEKMLQGIADPTSMAIKATTRAAPILEESVRSNIRASANRINKKNKKPYSTGELEKSIIATPAKKNQYGVFSVVKPNGTDKRGIPNALKANILEYGTHAYVEGKNQEPHPFIQKSVNQARQKCEEIMQRELDETVAKLW